MNNETVFINYNSEKLTSIGYNFDSLSEIVDRFQDYLEDVENEYKYTSISHDDLTNLLHKLEGSMNYLALEGPLNYIQLIRTEMNSENNLDVNQLLTTLFYISQETIKLIKKHYHNNLAP